MSESDRPNIVVVIDSPSSTAIATSGLGRALGRAVREAGLPGEIGIERLGPTELETRSWGGGALSGAAAAAPDVINVLRIYLPPALTGLAVDTAVSALARQIRDWRAESAHENLEVPIHAGPDAAVVYTVAVDPPWRILSGRTTARPTSPATVGGGASSAIRTPRRAASRWW